MMSTNKKKEKDLEEQGQWKTFGKKPIKQPKKKINKYLAVQQLRR